MVKLSDTARFVPVLVKGGIKARGERGEERAWLAPLNVASLNELVRKKRRY